jgi:DNA-binding XRE family transcriptional regulator
LFRNLEAEMARQRITKGDLAKFLGVRYATVVDKTKGRSRFYYEECLSIKKHFFPDCELEYLFAVDQENIAQEETCATSA